MPPLPTFPFTEVKTVSRWSNFHGTVKDQQIPLYCTPDVMGDSGMGSPRRLRRHGDALKAIIEHCFTQNPPANLRVRGGRWSLSNIIKPEDVMLDPANLNVLLRVRTSWLTADYQSRRSANGFVPVFAQCGVEIASMNRRLAETGLALQTSGASDGHRVVGCIATGTHGSALQIGAVHDTALAFHVITGPGESIFLQPSDGACTDDVAEWVERETGIATRSVRDDEMFHAMQVCLGSLGVVHAVVFETVPLYQLRQRQVVRNFDDPEVWRAISTMETRPFHPGIEETPYHFQIVLHPYPAVGRAGAFITMLWKIPADGLPTSSPDPVEPQLASDTMGLIGKLAEHVDLPGSTHLLRLLLDDELGKRYPTTEGQTGFPGEVFGPTGAPPGHGTSTEVVVNQMRARDALDALYDVLRSEAAHGRHLLGATGVRFAPQSQALLGMNIHRMNCYIEPQSIRNREVEGIYTKWWDKLEAEGIPFTCHWGQRLEMNRVRLENYFGDRVERWQSARRRLLPSETARRVFATPVLREVGLE